MANKNNREKGQKQPLTLEERRDLFLIQAEVKKGLENKIQDLVIKGEEIDNSVVTELQLASLDLQSAEKKISGQVGFDQSMGSFLKRVKKIEDALKKFDAPEDKEYKIHANQYHDIRKSLNEFFEYVSNHSLGASVGKEISDYASIVAEMENFLDLAKKTTDQSKKEEYYVKFKEAHDILFTDLKELKAKAEEEAEKQKAAREAKYATENEKRKNLKDIYEKQSNDFTKLTDVLKAMNVSGYDKEVKVLGDYLERARLTDGPDELEVWEEIFGNFKRDFAELLAKLDPNVKEAFEKGVVASNPEEKERQEQRERFKLEDGAKYDFNLLSKILRGEDTKEKALEETYKGKMQELQGFLDVVKKTNNQKDKDVFEKNLKLFNDKFGLLLETLKKDNNAVYLIFENDGVVPKKEDRRQLSREWEKKLNNLNNDIAASKIKDSRVFAAELNALSEDLRIASEKNNVDFKTGMVEFENKFSILDTKVRAAIKEAEELLKPSKKEDWESRNRLYAESENKLKVLEDEVKGTKGEKAFWEDPDYVNLKKYLKAAFGPKGIKDFDDNMAKVEELLLVVEGKIKAAVADTKAKTKSTADVKSAVILSETDKDTYDELVKQIQDKTSVDEISQLKKLFLVDKNPESEAVQKSIDELEEFRSKTLGEMDKYTKEQIDDEYKKLRELTQETLDKLEKFRVKSKPASPDKNADAGKDILNERNERILAEVPSSAVINDLLDLFKDPKHGGKCTDEEWDVVMENFREFNDNIKEMTVDNLISYTNKEFEEKLNDLKFLGKVIIKELTEFRDRPESVVSKPNNKEPVAVVTPDNQTPNANQPAKPKKGFFTKLKEGFGAVFNRETGKIAKGVGYDTVTSVLGIKIATDFVYGLATGKGKLSEGKGDLAAWWKGRKESQGTLESIELARQSIAQLMDEARSSKDLNKGFVVQMHIDESRQKIESSNLPDDAKKVLLDRLTLIDAKNREEIEEAVKERDERISQVMAKYEANKVSGIKIAKDAMNLVLTATGFSMLRGIMYAGASVAERWGKEKKAFAAKQVAEAGKDKVEQKFIGTAKDVIVNSAIETVRGLTFRGKKEGLSGKKRVVNFIKAAGTVARGLGIAHIAFSGIETPAQSMDRLLVGMKENGVIETLGHNVYSSAEHTIGSFAHNIKRGWNAVTGSASVEGIGASVFPQQPTPGSHGYRESIYPDTGVSSEPIRPSVVPDTGTAAKELIPSHSELPFTPEHHQTAASTEVQIAASANQLNPEFVRSLPNSLQKLVHDYPALNNPDSMRHILDADQVGSGVHSHHDFIKAPIGTLDQGGAERRQVIFEELLKKDTGAAERYLQEQHFSDQHLSHLPAKYVHDGKLDTASFVKDYNTNVADQEGLFYAEQGRESTDLANAGMEAKGVDNHVHGKVSYFGVENKQPDLRGTGTVTVDQMGTRLPKEMPVESAQIPKPKSTIDIAAAEKKIYSDYHTITEANADRQKFNKMLDSITDEKAPSPTTNQEGLYVEKTIATYKANEKTPIAELSNRAVSTPVEAKPVFNTEKSASSGSVVAPALEQQGKAQPVVLPVEKRAPEKAVVASERLVGGTFEELLKSQGVSREQFVNTFKLMSHAAEIQLKSELVLRGEAEKFFNKKFDNLQVDPQNLTKVKDLLALEKSFNAKKSDWLKTFTETMFGKDDDSKDLNIALASTSERNTSTSPMIANGGHAMRIWDSSSKKDVFLYDDETKFSINKTNGRLIIENTKGLETVQKDAKEFAQTLNLNK